jgi:hypothetical protein
MDTCAKLDSCWLVLACFAYCHSYRAFRYNADVSLSKAAMVMQRISFKQCAMLLLLVMCVVYTICAYDEVMLYVRYSSMYTHTALLHALCD